MNAGNDRSRRGGGVESGAGDGGHTLGVHLGGGVAEGFDDGEGVTVGASRSSWVTKSDLSRYVRCPYSWWLLDSGRIPFEETVDEFQAALVAGGVEFQDQVEAAAAPLEVAPGELKRLLRQDIRTLGTPTFENRRLRIKGRPDGIDAARGALYPIEVKSHKAVTALDELELAFYWLLLEPLRTRRDVSPRGLVVLRRQGKAVTVEVAIGQHRLDRVAELLAEISMNAWRKVRNSMVNSARRCLRCWSAQRPLTGRRRAHQALILQAREAIVMYAQLATRVLTGAWRARMAPLSWAWRFSWLHRFRASATTWWALILRSLVM